MRDVVVRLYGLYGRDPMSQKEVADEFGTYQTDVWRVAKKAKRMLSALMETKNV